MFHLRNIWEKKSFDWKKNINNIYPMCCNPFSFRFSHQNVLFFPLTIQICSINVVFFVVVVVIYGSLSLCRFKWCVCVSILSTHTHTQMMVFFTFFIPQTNKNGCHNDTDLIFFCRRRRCRSIWIVTLTMSLSLMMMMMITMSMMIMMMVMVVEKKCFHFVRLFPFFYGENMSHFISFKTFIMW